MYHRISIVQQDMSWMERANCLGTDTESFFPDKDAFSTYREEELMAIKTCGHCPVRRACLKFALKSVSTSGIYGGLPANVRWALHGAYERTSADERVFLELLDRGEVLAKKAYRVACEALDTGHVSPKKLREPFPHGATRDPSCGCQDCIDATRTAYQRNDIEGVERRFRMPA